MGYTELYQQFHYPEICEWFQMRKMKAPPRWALSDTGYLVKGNAAGFLYLTNSGMARIDFLITNPDTKKSDRDFAIDSIISRITTEAHCKYAVKLLCCESDIKSVQDRARRLKFIDTGTFIGFAKEL